MEIAAPKNQTADSHKPTTRHIKVKVKRGRQEDIDIIRVQIKDERWSDKYGTTREGENVLEEEESERVQG